MARAPTGQDDDNVEVDLKDTELQIEVEDDTPTKTEADRLVNRALNRISPDDDEIGQYTKGVQDRLRQLRWEYHEERRAKEAALRENEQAVNIAKRTLEQNQRLQRALSEGHKLQIEATTASAESEISAVRTALSSAIAAGDNDKIAELNVALGRATARAEAAKHTRPIEFEEAPKQPPRVPEQPQAPRPPVLSARMEEWLEENPWFQKDERMTAIAMAAHERLIKSGVRVESKAYYDGIDKEVREVFPQEFNRQGGSPSRRASNVAPTMRSAPGNSGKVVLTASEARVAEKLGVPLKVYAAEKLKRQQEQV